MRARLSGVDTGGGRYLRRDVTTTFTTGVARISRVDLEKHTMTVFEGGRRVRTIPVSGGSPEYPTWNGTTVVLRKQAVVRMTSASVGIDDHYDLRVPWAVHTTTSGTYTRAALWNEGKGSFGRGNTSHGCVGMSAADGRWFHGRSVPGDLIEVTGSTMGHGRRRQRPRRLEPGLRAVAQAQRPGPTVRWPSVKCWKNTVQVFRRPGYSSASRLRSNGYAWRCSGEFRQGDPRQ